MKILLVKAACQGNDKHTAPDFNIFADSALMADRRQPLFLPRWCNNWQLRLLPAVRISRQGRNIAAKFATRYFDAITVMAILVPVTEHGTAPEQSNLPANAAFIADEALRSGQWIDIREIESSHIEIKATYSALSSPEHALACVIKDFNIDVTASIIASVSSFASFKTGDIIILDIHPEEVTNDNASMFNDIKPDNVVTAHLNSLETLKIKIK